MKSLKKILGLVLVFSIFLTNLPMNIAIAEEGDIEPSPTPVTTTAEPSPTPEAVDQPPTVPQNVVYVESTETSISIIWDSSTDDFGVAGYDVYRGGSVVARSTSASFTDTDLIPGTSYTYTVVAIDTANQQSGMSAELNVSTNSDSIAPSVPVNFRYTSKTAASIDFAWDASTDNIGVTGYTVYSGDTPLESTDQTVLTLTNLASGTTYEFTVRAYDAAGNESQASDIISIMTLPGIPTDITSTSTTSTITLNWAPVIGAVGYDIYSDKYGSTTETTSTSYTDTNLSLNTQYPYKIRAKTADGTGEWSDFVNIWTQLNTPSGLSITAEKRAMRLAWSSVSYATSYDIEIDGNIVANVATTSYVHENLAPGEVHVYRIKAKNSNTESAWTESISKTVIDYTPISGTISSNRTLTPEEGPYGIVGNLVIASGVTLTIEAGTLLRVNPGTHIYINGTIQANGDELHNINFTSMQDELFGGAGVIGIQDYWGRIEIRDNGAFYGNYVNMYYGGQYNTVYEDYNYNIYITGLKSTLVLTNSRIKYADNNAIQIDDIVRDLTLQVARCTLESVDNKGLFFESNAYAVGTVSITENTFIGCGLYINKTGSADFIVDNNTFMDNDQTSIYIRGYGTGILSIKYNMIQDTTNYPLLVFLDGLETSIFECIDNNTFINNVYLGNQVNELTIWGQVPAGKTFTLPGNRKYIAYSGYGVSAGATLNIEAGACILADGQLTTLDASGGSLNLLGTYEAPVVLTTLHDKDFGGGGVSGDSDRWDGIYVSGGCNVKAEYAVIRYAYWQNIYCSSGKMDFRYCEISYAARLAMNIGGNGTDYVFRYNSFICNSPTRINYAGSGYLDLSYNYFGTPYKPTFSGSNIIYTPYIGAESAYQFRQGTPGVSSATGNYSTNDTDLAYSAAGFQLGIERYYNSNDSGDIGLLGKGWKTNFESRIEDYAYQINKSDGTTETITLSSLKTVYLLNGRMITFSRNASGTYDANDSRNTLIRLDDGSYQMTTPDCFVYHFSSDGYLASVEDRNGNALTFEYNSDRKLTAITDQTGRQLTFSYNEQGYINQVTDPLNRVVTYGYNADGSLINVVNPMSATTTYEYNENGLLCTVKSNDGATVEAVVYNTVDDENKGKVSQITDQYGNVKTYSYDNVNRNTTITDSNGRITVQEYDGNYTVNKSTDPDGRSVTVAYFLDDAAQNRFWEVKSTTDRNGNKITYERDSRGNVTKIINPDSSYRQMVYDSNNNLISLRDEEGKYTYYIYDSNNKNLIKQVKPLNGTDVYDGSTDEGFAITTYTYYLDAESLSLGYSVKGLIKTSTDPEGGVTTYTYDANGYPQSVTDAMGETTHYTYNAVGWLIQEISPSGNTTSYAYDNNGNLIKKIMDGGETFRTVYDGENKLLKEIQPSQYQAAQDDAATFAYFGDHGTRYTYYNSGKVHTVTDAEDNVTAYTYDLYGNVATETNPDGASYRYEYDFLNRLIKTFYMEDANSDEVLLEEVFYSILSGGFTQKTVQKYIDESVYLSEIYKYDYANRQVEKRNADGTTLKTEYYKNGLQKSSTDANNKTSYARYNGLNQLTELWTPFEANGSSVAYAYTCYAYDKAGRKTSEKRGLASVALYSQPSNYVTATYEYDANGNLIVQTDSAGSRTEYEYDNDGLLARRRNFTDSGNYIRTEYTNNYWGKPDVIRVYVREGDISEHSFSDNDPLALTTDYTYDVNGNIATETAPNGVMTTYTYDKLNRLTGMSQPGTDEYGSPVTIETKRIYDYAGNVVSEIDANSNETVYDYDGRGFLTRKMDALGGVTLSSYDLLGRLIANVSPLNYKPGQALSSMNRTEFAYDPMGRVKTLTQIYFDADSSQWISYVYKAYKYDANGNMVKELDSLGYAAGTGSTVDAKINSGYGVEYTYNYASLILTMLDPVAKSRSLSFSTKYAYNALGRVISETGANNAIKLYTYDDTGNLLSVQIKKNQTSSAVMIQSATYDKLRHVLTQTDGNGNTVTYTYNELGLIRTATYPQDDSISEYVVSMQYDMAGNLAHTFDNDGIEKQLTYDNQDRLLSDIQQNNDGTDAITLLKAYDKNGNIRFATDGNGHATEYVYDALNRLTETTIEVSQTEQTTVYTYDSNSNLLSVTDWLGNTTTNEYDPLNRLVEKQNAYGVIIEKLVYNNNDLQTTSTDALGNVTQYTYDRNNRLLTTKDSANHVTGKTYDNVGNINTEYDGKNYTTKYEYDEYNRLIKVTNPKSEVTTYTYDLNGNLLTQTDGIGNTKAFEYNVVNKLIKSIDAGGRTGSPGNYTYDPNRTVSYNYNRNGSLYSMTDRNGVTTIFTYDSHGRLLNKQAGALSVSFTYDDNGNQLTMTDATGTTVRTYDELNRVTSKTVPVIGTATYTYDITDGQITGNVAERAIDPAGNITLKVYDKVGRLYSVAAGTDVTVYTYYANGAKQSVTYSSGAQEEYTYLEGTLLSGLINRRPDGTVMDSYTYAYDAAHNQISKTETINGVLKGTTTYSYDSLNRLLVVTEPTNRKTTYAYDKAGNRYSETIVAGLRTTIKTYTYNEQNRLTGIQEKVSGVTQKGWAYGYDNNGNLLSTTETAYVNGVPQTPTVTANTYDTWNQLVETITLDYTVENTYNGEGLRVAKEVNGVKTWHFYEYTNIVLETDDSGNEAARNIYGTNLVKRIIGTTEYHYFYNGHADVTALVNASTGLIVASYYYDAFGVVLESVGTVNNNILYAGYQYDKETGLYYLNARMYDPSIARFLQEDTYIGNQKDPLSLNLYTYCRNEPLMYSDPTGHREVTERDERNMGGGIPPSSAQIMADKEKNQNRKNSNDFLSDIGDFFSDVGEAISNTMSDIWNFIVDTKTAIVKGNSNTETIIVITPAPTKENPPPLRPTPISKPTQSPVPEPNILDEFIEYLEEQANNKAIYVWGAQGDDVSTMGNPIEWIEFQESSYNGGEHTARAVNGFYTRQELGGDFKAFDCSGLGMYWLMDVNGFYSEDMSANGLMRETTRINQGELERGDWVFRVYEADVYKDGELIHHKGEAYHVGYVVDDELNVIEAKGRDDGVVKLPFDYSEGYWNQYGRPYIFMDWIG